MGGKRIERVFAADFETTVFNDQEFTEVWAAGLCEIGTDQERVDIFNSIHSFFRHIFSLNVNTKIYFHNLKFDGTFILPYLFDNGFNPSLNAKNEYDHHPRLFNNEFVTCISDMGQWYYIEIMKNGKRHRIYDSLKLIPFPVRDMPKAFGLDIEKLELEYKGFRYAGMEIPEEEKEYLKNDVLILKRSLEYMFNAGINSITIGSSCLKEYRKGLGNLLIKFRDIMPKLDAYEISEEYFEDGLTGSIDRYIRAAYKGGWCYADERRRGKIINRDGITLDVNSLYPYVMHGMSGNRYPVGLPTFWKGNFIPDEALNDAMYYFIRIKTKFKIRKDHLPCIQIKGHPLYIGREWLTSSTFFDGTDVAILDGEKITARPVLTLTMTDFELIRNHYTLYDFEILDGCYFKTMTGLFDQYLDHYRKIKEQATLDGNNGLRTIAKLMSNNLYGKMASNTESSYKIPSIDADGIVHYETIIDFNKPIGYIPIGAAITSYARCYTITAAQKNYDRFCYADTDSIHLIGTKKAKGVEYDSTRYGCWDKEVEWSKAVFLRQKAYIERDHKNNYIIKCSGMPKRSKDLFAYSIQDDEKIRKKILFDLGDLNPDESEFIEKKRSLKDFNIGLCVPGKLRPVQIKGGTILMDTTFELRENIRI